MTPVLQLKGITKRFPGVLANDHIDLTLNEGEILALLGENGAGKSTLMNILYGLYQPDEGEIYVRGQKITVHSPLDAIRAGIGMVHQHFMLIPVFTVTENVMLGAETVRMGDFLDREKTAQRIREISERYHLEVDPYAYVRDLPVGVQQRVEIIKLLFREADILIFDEPTAVLTPQEADELFVIMRELVKQGKSIIFITHKLREVLEISDRIMVIRRGKVVGETTPAEADKAKLAEMMVGRTVRLEVEKEIAKAFIEKFVNKVSTFKVGNPKEPDTIIGPLINQQQFNQVRNSVEAAVREGAKVLCGARSEGLCYYPTILINVKPGSPFLREETFGPVVSIIEAKDEEEAVAIANETMYGLSAAVFTSDVAKGIAIAERIESGIVHINDQTVHDEPQVPFGGMKDSGWGRFGGRAALEEFTELRWISIQRSMRHYPF
ncbi:aldehyde dehydrogenase family protein [uncultured Anaerolinea sp.]|uniref:aldehyde dehydrogenase family protein n=1 Tax=uncultured Anaerolinea sp. TaxID=430695 RepID=UPI002634674A|nr:aldehyde dehydrogenase family protein [uncultured Anaerolinea sp.]